MFIKTNHGFFTISTGIITWYFYEQSSTSACQAYADHDLDKLDTLCILKVNDKTSLMALTNWPNGVTNSFSLINQLKRDRLAKERKEESSFGDSDG